MKLLRKTILPERVARVVLRIRDEIEQKNDGKPFGILVNIKDPENPDIIVTEKEYPLTSGIFAIIPKKELVLSDNLAFSGIETWKSVTIHTIFMHRLQAVIDDLQNKIGSQPQKTQVLLFDVIQGVFTTMTLGQYSKPWTSKGRFLKIRSWNRKKPLPTNVEEVYLNMSEKLKNIIMTTMYMDLFPEEDEDNDD